MGRTITQRCLCDATTVSEKVVTRDSDAPQKSENRKNARDPEKSVAHYPYTVALRVPIIEVYTSQPETP